MSTMNAKQILEVWRSFHSVELTELQQDKLLAAVNIIADGSYMLGKKEGLAEATRLADAKNWPSRVQRDPQADNTNEGT